VSGVRALIWSGDIEFRRVARQLLTFRGCDVVASSRGPLVRPDAELLLVDIDTLPPTWRRDISTLRMRNRSAALILVSASWVDFARLQAWRPCGYVRKPFGAPEVARVIRALVPDVLQQTAPLDAA
jgi:hypothetical protein